MPASTVAKSKLYWNSKKLPFSSKLLQEEVFTCARTVWRGEETASGGISLLFVSSAHFMNCGESRCLLAELLRCLNHTPERLSAYWLIPIFAPVPAVLNCSCPLCVITPQWCTVCWDFYVKFSVKSKVVCFVTTTDIIIDLFFNDWFDLECGFQAVLKLIFKKFSSFISTLSYYSGFFTIPSPWCNLQCSSGSTAGGVPKSKKYHGAETREL